MTLLFGLKFSDAMDHMNHAICPLSNSTTRSAAVSEILNIWLWNVVSSRLARDQAMQQMWLGSRSCARASSARRRASIWAASGSCMSLA